MGGHIADYRRNDSDAKDRHHEAEVPFAHTCKERVERALGAGQGTYLWGARKRTKSSRRA
jgi:hypothetical protein